MPETGALIGTPASMHARVEPQTDAIDDDPFDSSVSDTMRIVYGNSSAGGMTASSARCASAPWPMSRRFGPRMKPVSPTEYGGEVEGGLDPPPAPRGRAAVRRPPLAVPGGGRGGVCGRAPWEKT